LGAPSRLIAHRQPARVAVYVAPGGPWDAPSLDELLDTRLAVAGDRAVLVDDTGARLLAHEMRDEVARLAGALHALGIGAGDVVSWQLENRVDAALLPRACWRLGAVAAPVHHRALRNDAAAMLVAVSPRVVIAPSGAPASAVAPCAVVEPHGPWREQGAPAGEARKDPAGIAAALFTSGSSGTPKAVLHDARALAYKARVMVPTHDLGPDDVVLMPAPLAHVSGLLNAVLVPGAVPFRVVLMARWDPGHALELIEREGVTFMVGPPTFFVSLMDAPGFTRERVTSLRLVSSGGAGVSAAFCERAAERLGARVKRTYGSTEAPTVATSRTDDDIPVERRHDGRAVGEVELRVVDPESGVDRAEGETGEVWVRGPEVCLGYVDAADTAAAFTPDGWFRTGDLGTLERDGWLTIVGRLKEVVIRGGENISTNEVESVLEAHPAVRAAVAVGYPDDVLGERVCAFVVAEPGFDLEACRAWFAEQGIARYKTPERVVRVDALPQLATGKPDRAALRERAAGAATM
jgi:cyclohexanecarboxylate-CoA ligase